MTQEEKQLLLKDLCARVPYGVKVKLLCRGPEPKFDDWIEATLNTKDIELFGKSFKNIKPYLRLMSSMTSKEWVEFCDCSLKDEMSWVWTGNRQKFIPVQNREDYLNSKHFDYRGLIEKGLALEASEDMYNIK